MQHLSSSLNHRARALYLCIISSFPSRCSIDPRNPLTKREGGCHFWHPKPKTHIFPQHHDLPLPRCAITLHSQLFRFWPRPRPPTSFGSFLMDDRKREGSINGAKVCINKGRKKEGRGGVLLLLSLLKGFGGCSQPLRSMHSVKDITTTRAVLFSTYACLSWPNLTECLAQREHICMPCNRHSHRQ